MALQSSGQISLSDIANEQEIALSNVSLRSMSSTAGFTTPDSVSEFYGYAYKYYWDLSNDIKWDTATDKPLQSNTESFSASLWIRPQWAATDLNLIIFDLTPSGTTTTANRFFLQYDYGLNRFVARYRSSQSNFTRQWDLHNNKMLQVQEHRLPIIGHHQTVVMLIQTDLCICFWCTMLRKVLQQTHSSCTGTQLN